MKILFGTKYFKKDTSEVPSSFLIWVIEEYEGADTVIVMACKEELVERLKLNLNPSEAELDLRAEVRTLRKENRRLLSGKIFFEKICWIFGIEEPDYMYYFRSQNLLDQDIEQYNKDGFRLLPYRWAKTPFWQRFKRRERYKLIRNLQNT